MEFALFGLLTTCQVGNDNLEMDQRYKDLLTVDTESDNLNQDMHIDKDDDTVSGFRTLRWIQFNPI